MTERQWLAEKFEENRAHLRAVAYRILGSATEADDAVQETWLRLDRSDDTTIDNLGAWLTTVVSRICLDMLRSRGSRREDPLETESSEPPAVSAGQPNPEQQAMLADSVGVALLVVLDRLDPAERLAFVLHDMFAVPFEEIASIVGRTPEAARQLASRARRCVQGPAEVSASERIQQRKVVDAFLGALRAGDFEGLIKVLDPDVAVHIDETAARPGAPREIRGARAWAKGAVAFSQMARSIQPALVDGAVGLIWAPGGRLARALKFKFESGKIAEVEIIADPARLGELDLGVLPD